MYKSLLFTYWVGTCITEGAVKIKCFFSEWMCPRSNYITTALSWPNMADNSQGGAGLTGLLPWEQRSLSPLPPFLSVCLCGTHIHRETRAHTVSQAHSYTHSVTVESAWLCDPRYADWKQEARWGAKGDTPHLFWMVSAGWPVIVCLFAASLSKSAPHYARMVTAVGWLAVLEEEGMCHMCGFILIFSLWFHFTFFIEAVIVMAIHSLVAIAKSVPTTTTTPLLLNALV